MKKFFVLLPLMVFSMLIVSCGDDDGNDGNVNCSDSFSINNELNDEINAFATAAGAYGTDPSAANCQAYKDAAQDYLDALEALKDCAEEAGQLTSFNQALANLEAAFDTLTC